MVIQRETNAAVWGWAEPSEKVTIDCSWGVSTNTRADQQGNWKVFVKTPKAGGHYDIKIRGEKDTLIFEGVHSGDVWFCSGQSNMKQPMINYYPKERIKKEAEDSKIHFFITRKNCPFEDQHNVVGEWMLSSEKIVSSFSATAFFFGKKLQQETDVPIGLVLSAWSGKRIEYFIPWEEIQEEAYLQEMRDKVKEAQSTFSEKKAQLTYEEDLEQWKERVTIWEQKGKKGWQPKKPKKAVPPIQEGKHPGGIFSGMIHPFLGMAMKGVIWYQGESNSQGLQTEGHCNHYQSLLTKLITSWRNEWSIGTFPFYFVQLPEFGELASKPVMLEDAWPYTRQSMLNVHTTIPNTGMAVALGLGEAGNVHPKKKQEVGELLARLALKNDYGKPIPYSGPIATSCNFKGNRVIVNFDNGGAALSFANECGLGFAIVNQKGETQKASAKILSENSLEIIAKNQQEIKEVYYAWAANPKEYSLENTAHLKASPFRFIKP